MTRTGLARRLGRAAAWMVLAGLVAGTTPASAQKPRDIEPVPGGAAPEGASLYPNSWALVIGINKYQRVPGLSYAVTDARAVAQALPALGFPRENIRLLLDGQATKTRIERVLYADFANMGPDDRLLVFFAGHGETLPIRGGEEGYLLPVNADPNALPLTAIPNWLALGALAVGMAWLAPSPPPRCTHGIIAAGVLAATTMGSDTAEIQHFLDACPKVANMTDRTCKQWSDREVPRHSVRVDAFHIDQHEVTSARFEKFVTATAHRTAAEREGWAWSYQQKDGTWQYVRVDGAEWRQPSGPGRAAEPNHPVVNVSWADAEAYCRWAGKRLPTEAEWEKAARGTDSRRYPWGPDWDSSKANARLAVKTTTAVGTYALGASPHGVHDLAGNVWEWVSDWLDKGYYARSPQANPRGPDRGTRKVVRGGSWHTHFLFVASARRHHLSPDTRRGDLGFRCAKTA